ncbi:hypothetical protein T440DRAFT_133456 [Plenodomus tracheiphilus IPT5]|uniref:Uncharacterized protein n=1 Tax=Plenodomus tracheiphilus IPT5 TaxID=1408161 RepID=A0A6A7B1N3_9PLEO|nr:hypothetical protein T440DRAFT_133456 [Plenodomus tracheiphilus IPT5]
MPLGAALEWAIADCILVDAAVARLWVFWLQPELLHACAPCDEMVVCEAIRIIRDFCITQTPQTDDDGLHDAASATNKPLIFQLGPI